MRPALPRALALVTFGVASIAACAAVAPRATAEPMGSAPVAPVPSPIALLTPSDAGAPLPRCPYGALEDPHRGFVRCLLPDERDAGWLPPPPQGDVPADTADAGAEPAPSPPPSGAVPSVEIGAPKFENGEVTKVEKSLGRAGSDLARCVADHGGLDGDVGSVKIQFLVRSRGRAEGVEVLEAKGVRAEAAACVRKVVKNRAIGAPTSDPVGVKVVLTFRAAK